MNPARLYGKGASFPFRVGADGHVAWSEGEANVKECLRSLLSADRNERLFQPDYGAGLQSFLFAPNTVTTRHQIAERIKTAITRWEPRVSLQAVSVEPDPADPQAAIATIAYRLVATRGSDSLALRVRLGA
jgi:hypothetical protein